MSAVTNYINNTQDISTVVTGKVAPQTGNYYSHIYSQDDPQTGVPTMGVELHNSISQQQALPLTNLTDDQILELVRSGKQVQDVPTQNTLNVEHSQTSSNQQVLKVKESTIIPANTTDVSSTTPFAGMFILLLLLVLIAFVYFIIRIWQDHQAQKLVMMSIKKKPITPEIVTNKETPVQVATTTTNNTEQWRSNMAKDTDKLRGLLTSKGLTGDTISDQLKTVKPGQFALADIAWEAQNSANKLLVAHTTRVSEQDIHRATQLFKQVFAEHGVV